MKALPLTELPEGDWLYEIKFEGYRALAFKDQRGTPNLAQQQGVQLSAASRNPEIAAGQPCYLDGEIVALDGKGRSSFQLLQMFKSSEQRVPLVYYVFDLLFLEGKDLRNKPLTARRKLLASSSQENARKLPDL